LVKPPRDAGKRKSPLFAHIYGIFCWGRVQHATRRRLDCSDARQQRWNRGGWAAL